MMADEEYDIVPHKRVLGLEKDIAQIKRDPLGASPSGKHMIETMDKLSDSMDKLVGLFEGASERMKQEESEAEVMTGKLDPLVEKLNDVIDQNKQIATGIVAVADLIKDWMEKEKRQQGGPLPPVAMPSRVAPRPAMAPVGPATLPHPMGPPPPGPMPPGPVTQLKPLTKGEHEKKMMGPLQEKPPMPPPPGISKATPFPPVGGPTAGPPPGASAPPTPPGMAPPPPMGVKPPIKKKKSLFGF